MITDSLKVADFFGKRHDHVLRDIENLVKRGLPNFGDTPYINPQNGETYRKYTMDRDGLTFLAMSFTGDKAFEFKKQYIAAFNAMEKKLKQQTPRQLSRMELLQMQMETEERRIAAEARVQEMLPKAEFFDAFLDSKGYYALLEAFEALGQKPNLFAKQLRQKGILYNLGGNITTKQEYLNRGYFEVKIKINESLGISFPQTYVTPKGMGWIRRRFIPAIAT